LRIGRKTGGIGRVSLTSLKQSHLQLPLSRLVAPSEASESEERGQGGEVIAWTFLRAKATMAQADELLAILHDILLTVRLDDQQRFLQMALQEKARQEAGIVPAGNFVASQRLKSHFNVADWAAEQTGGVSYLFFLRQLAEDVQHAWPSVLEKLEAIR